MFQIRLVVKDQTHLVDFTRYLCNEVCYGYDRQDMVMNTDCSY